MGPTLESRSWGEISGFYRELIGEHGWRMGPMLALVEFVASSPYAPALFPALSLDRLCIAQTREIQWQHAMLMIQFNPSADCFRFAYWEASLAPVPWRTSSPAQEGIARLERILIKRLRWFQKS